MTVVGSIRGERPLAAGDVLEVELHSVDYLSPVGVWPEFPAVARIPP